MKISCSLISPVSLVMRRTGMRSGREKVASRDRHSSTVYFGSPKWYENEHKEDPDAIKNKPELLDPVYAREAHKLLTKVIREYKDYPHYSHVGNGEFEWNDKAVAVALYNRAMFFRGSCKSDLARLVKEFPGLPSTQSALRDLGNSKSCK